MWTVSLVVFFCLRIFVRMHGQKIARCALVLSLSFTLAGCATLLNGPKTQMHVYTTDSTRVVLKGDTLPERGTHHLLTVERSGNALELALLGDSARRLLRIAPHTSPVYWLNIAQGTFMPLGFLLDQKHAKRYAFPRSVYVNMKEASGYERERLVQFGNRSPRLTIYLSPFRPFSWVDPGFSGGFMYAFGKSWALDADYSVLFSTNIWQRGIALMQSNSGFEARFGLRKYVHSDAPTGFYLGAQGVWSENSQWADLRFGESNALRDTLTSYEDISYRDTVLVNRKVRGIHLRMGQTVYSGHFTFDFSLGIGLLHRQNSMRMRLGPFEDNEELQTRGIYFFSMREGSFWMASIPLHFRLGYTIGGKHFAGAKN